MEPQRAGAEISAGSRDWCEVKIKDGGENGAGAEVRDMKKRMMIARE